MNKTADWLIVLLCGLLLPQMVLAQGASDEQTPVEQQTAQIVEDKPMAQSAVQATTQGSSDTPAARENAEIRFQFEGLPYRDVIRRFAQMAEKPLIGEMDVEGTLTFYDEEPYTYEEALDTLNVILSIRGMSLIESGRFLRLVKLDELQRMPLQILSGLENAENVRPGEVVTVVLPLTHLEAGEIGQAIQPMLTSAGSIASMTRGRGLIITDTLAAIQRIKLMLNTLDVEAPGQRQMITYTLENSSGAVVSELISRTFGKDTAPTRSIWNEERKKFDEMAPNPEDYVTAVFDPPSRTMVLFGPSDRLELAEQLIERFEQDAGTNSSEVKIFQPRTLEADELSRMILEAIPGTRAGRQGGSQRAGSGGATDARLIIDTSTNRLIVAAPSASQMAVIEQFIRQVDDDAQTSTDGEQTTITQVFVLGTSDPNSLRQILLDATSDVDSRGKRTPRLAIHHDGQTHSLIVTGSSADVQSAAKIIEDFETKTRPQPRQMRIIPLKHVDATAIRTTVEQLARERLRDQTAVGTTPPHYLADSPNRRLIVTATVEQLDQIQAIVTELDQEPVRLTRELRVMTVESQDATQILPMVRQLYQERVRGRSSEMPSPDFIADGYRLVVLALPEDLDQIEAIVQQLDGNAPAAPARELRAIELQHQEAEQIRVTVQQLYREQVLSRPDPPGGQATILTGPKQNVLLVSGTVDQIDRVEAIIRQIDTPPVQTTQPRQLRLIELSGYEVQQIKPVIEELYKEQQAGQPEPDGGWASIVANESSNKLIISGPVEQIEIVHGIVRALDGDGEAVAVAQTRVLRLQFTAAAELAGLVEKAMTDSRGRSPVRILVDEASNSLVFSGSSVAVEEAVQLVRQLDVKPQSQPQELHVIDLRSGSAKRTKPLLEQLLLEQMQRLHGERYKLQTAIMAEATDNRLFITAPQEEWEHLEGLIGQVNVDPTQTGNVRIFPLQHARARDLSRTLNDSLVKFDAYNRRVSRVAASPDTTTNSVIVSGQPTDLDAAALIVQQLDQPKENQPRELRVIALAKGNAREMAQLVSKLWQEQNPDSQPNQPVIITASPSGDQLIVLAEQQQLQAVEAMVSQLENRDITGPEMKLFELGGSDEVRRLLPLIQQLYQQQDGQPTAQILADEATGRLIATGPASEIEKIEQILVQLKLDDTVHERVTRVYELKNSQAGTLVRTLERLYKEQIRGQASAEPEPLILEDGATNRLVLMGTQPVIEMLHELVTQLDEVSEKADEAQIFHLVSADAKQMAQILSQAVVSRDARGRTTPRLSVGTDTLANALVVTGEPEDLRTAASIIAELDAPPTELEPRELRVFQLDPGRARDVGIQIRTLYEEQLKSRGNAPATASPAVVLDDASTDRLIVTASAADMEMISSMVAQLSGGDENTLREMRVIKLKQASANSVASVLSQMFAQQIKALDANRLLVSAAKDDLTLVIEAPVATLDRVEQLISALDNEESSRDLEVRAYRIQEQTNVDVLVRNLERLFTQQQPRGDTSTVRFGAEPGTNHLMVAANADKFEQIEQLIEQLQAGAELATQTRIFHLARGDAEQISRLLDTLLNDAQPASRGRRRPSPATEALTKVVAATSHHAVVVQGTPEKIALAEELINSLDANEMDARSTIRTIRLQNSDAATLANAVNQAMADRSSPGKSTQMHVTPEPNSNSLLVQGSNEQIEQVLALVQELDGQSMDTGVEVRIYRLETGNASDIAATLSDLLGEVFKQQAGRAPGGSMPPLTITADARSNSLLVATTTSHFAIVEQLLDELKQVPDQPQRQVEYVWIENANAFDVGMQLRAMFSSRELADQPIIQSDYTSNSLTLIGHPDDLQMMAPIITKLDDGALERQVQIRMVSASPMQADQLAKLLVNLYSQMTTSNIQVLDQLPAAVRPAVPGASSEMGGDSLPDSEVEPASGDDEADDRPLVAIVVDRTTNSLLISAPRREHREIRELISELSYSFLLGDAEFRTYKLEQADPVAMADTLDRLFNPRAAAPQQARQRPQRQENDRNNDRVDSKEAADNEESHQNEQPIAASPLKINVVPESRTRSIIVRARPRDFVLIEPLIQQLDQVATVISEVRIFTLVHADAEAVAMNLREVFHSATESDRTGRPPQPQPNAMPSHRAISLRQADRLLQIDRSTLPTITANRQSNSLVVAGVPEAIEAIEQIIVELDQSVASSHAPAIRLYPLAHAQVEPTVASLREVFMSETGSQASRNRGTQQPATPVIITGNEAARLVLVSAVPDQHPLIASVIADLDQAHGATSTIVRVYRLNNADARTVATALMETLEPVAAAAAGSRSTTQRTGTSELRISADPSSNALVVRASEDLHARIVQLLADMDGEDAAEQAVRLIRLKSANSENVARLLKQVFVEPAASRDDMTRTNRIIIEADRDSQALMVQADDATFERIEELARQFDAPVTPGEMHLLPIQNADPAEVQKAIEDLFGQKPAAGGAAAIGDGRVRVNVLAQQRALMVQASDEDYEAIEALAAAMEEAAATHRTQIQIFELEHASKAHIAQALTTMFQAVARTRPNEPAVSITALPRANAVVVSATQEAMQEVARLIEQLDTPVMAGDVQLRVYPLEHVEPGRILPAVEQMLQEIRALRPEQTLTVTADERTRSLLVVAEPDMFEPVERIIAQLDTPPAFAEAEMVVVNLRRAQASQLAQVLQAMLRPAEGGQVTPEALALQDQVRLLRLRNGEGNPIELDLTKPIKIMADPLQTGQRGGNRLILSSTADNLKALEAIALMMDTVPVAEGVKVRMIHLEHADATTTAGTLQDIFTQGQRFADGPVEQTEPDSVSGKALVHPLNISADVRTNTIVLSGREESIALAELVVADLDRDIERFMTEVRLFRLQHAAADRLEPLLASVFAESAATEGTAGLTAQVTRLRTVLPETRPQATDLAGVRAALTIQSDAGTNALIVAARSDVMPLIADVIRTLDIPDAGGMQTLRIYVLEHAEAERVQQLVQDLYSGPRAAQLETHNLPTVTVDQRTNALIVAGDTAARAMIESLIEELDTEVTMDVRDIRILPLNNADATALAGVLNPMLEARVQRRANGDSRESELLRVIVMADERTNSLLIGGSRDGYELVRTLAEQLDQAGSALGRLVRLVPLVHANAQTLAATLTELFNERYQTDQAEDVQRQRPILVPDMRTNSLLISADVEDNHLLDGLIAQLDQESTDQLSDLRVYPLRYASASRLGPTLQQLFDAKDVGESIVSDPGRLLPVAIYADSRTNTLLVAASPQSFAAVERMIHALDVEQSTSADVFRIFGLKHASATQLQATLTKLFIDRPNHDPEAPLQPITIVADAWTNAILVGAGPEDMAMVASLVTRLDSKPEQPGMKVHVVPIVKADARRVAETIQSLYRTSPDSDDGVLVTVDERLNALVVSTGETDLLRIQELVRKLDTAHVSSISEIRVFPLRNAEAVDLAEILTQTLNQQPPLLTDQSPERQTLLQFITRTTGGEDSIASALQDGMLITPDPRTNSLLISGALDSMPLLEQLIAALDTASAQMAQIQVFALRNADANQMATILRSLFRLENASGASESNRSVSYTLVSQNSAEGGGASAIMGSAEKHALSVTVDVRTNSLLVGGTEHYVQLAKQLIEELDSSPAQERTTKVYRLRNAQTADIEAALLNFLDQERQRITQTLGSDALGAAQRLLEREVAIVGEPSSGSLLLSASPRYFDTVAALIEELDQPPPQVLIEVLLAEVMLDSTMELGVEWGLQSMVDGATVDVGTDFNLAAASNRIGGFTVAVSGGDLDFLLRALQSDGRLEVLSRPQILAADNQLAEINIGQSVPLIRSISVTDGGNVNSTVDYRDVGVILRVLPRISPDGFVKLDVEPEISSLSTSNVDVGQGVRAPIVNQRRATTTVSVRSGHTIMIGGIISTRDDVREDKVPFLGDLPLVGGLFRSSTNVEERSELLIVLRPHILRNTEDADALTSEYISRSTPLKQFEEDGTFHDEAIRSLVGPYFQNATPPVDNPVPSDEPQPNMAQEVWPARENLSQPE